MTPLNRERCVNFSETCKLRRFNVGVLRTCISTAENDTRHLSDRIPSIQSHPSEKSRIARNSAGRSDTPQRCSTFVVSKPHKRVRRMRRLLWRGHKNKKLSAQCAAPNKINSTPGGRKGVEEVLDSDLEDPNPSPPTLCAWSASDHS